MLSDEIGGGVIRGDVQHAIENELRYRLGDGDGPSALTRREKELLLLALNGVKPNACLSQLHARSAIKAGASADEVLESALTVILVGMVRWKMAAMGAFTYVEEFSSSGGIRTVKNTKTHDASIDDMRKYIHKVLNREFPDMWETLAAAAPGVLEGYMRLRESIVRPGLADGALPKRMVELAIVICDVIQANSWGAQMHVRQAIRDGATVPQVVEAIALAMIESGVPAYKTGGLEVIEAAEDESAKAD